MFDNFARGIAAARGKYLTYFHDDDIYAPDFLRQHVALLEANDRVGFSGSNCLIVDDDSRVIGRRALIACDGVWPGRRYIATLLRLGVNVFPMQSLVFRTAVLGPTTFHRSMSVHFSDFVVLMRLAERHDVGVLAAPLLHMRDHQGQASKALPMREAIELRTRVLLDYCAEVGGRWPEEQAFARQLERRVVRSRRIGLLWGWVSSPSAAEARDCLVGLDRGRLERALRRVLMELDRRGVSYATRHNILLPALRWVGYASLRRSRVATG